MKRIKIWLNWFSAKDARTLVENYSGLKPTLRTIAKQAKEGVRECFSYGLTPKDINNLVKLGYSVELYSKGKDSGTEYHKYLIKW